MGGQTGLYTVVHERHFKVTQKTKTAKTGEPIFITDPTEESALYGQASAVAKIAVATNHLACLFLLLVDDGR